MNPPVQARWLRLFSPEYHHVAAVGFERLVALYSEPHRHYHDGTHIEACLHHFDRMKWAVDDPHATELALWFHDAIYDTHRNDNELQSALLAMKEISTLGASEALQQKVHDLIMATKHPSIPANNDQALLLDIDLAILGAFEEVFDHYEHQIRQEYHWVPESVYRTERTNVLKTFLDQPFIYHSQTFLQEREDAARINLKRSIECLERG